MLKATKIQNVKIRYVKEIGKKIFQPKFINWSYLYRGKAALITTYKITKKQTFKLNQKKSGKISKNIKGANHPPQNNITFKQLIINILAYSPKENKAKVIAEYSTLYPDTNSASASGKSKGCLLVSANPEIKKINANGKKGITNQTFFCASIIKLRLNDPEHKTITIIINPKEISYETIWAVERKAPKNAYFELLDQPDKIIP